MFRPKSDQGMLFSAATVLSFLSEKKRKRVMKSWAWAFRTRVLPLIDEEQFRHLYCEDNGRPNKAVQTLIGVLLLKEWWDLTDEQTLSNLEYNLLWHIALDVDLEEAHACQKTLHNFRVRLMEQDSGALLFKSLVGKMIAEMGVKTDKQRLDSTHIMSNIARLTRLGLFCETIAVFLKVLKKAWPDEFNSIPISIRQRYLKDDGSSTRFGDASSKESRRRLGVCARDVWRLVDRFRGHDGIKEMESYGLLVRLFEDQCEVVEEPVNGVEGDADVEEPGVPVVQKEAKKVASDSLQSPHDPDVTYSGHKGKGYEVQVAETFGNEEAPELITHVELTRSCDSDDQALMPAVEDLAERGHQPEELDADTTYGSTENAMKCEERGTELVAPVPGPEVEKSKDGKLRKGAFEVDPTGQTETRCPAGQVAISEERDEETGKICATFDADVCVNCVKTDICPARKLRDGSRVLQTTKKTAVLEQRRDYEQTEEFKSRYANRAGIEGTNSELKRAHGIGRIRTRGSPRVRLSVYLKAAACNVKRVVNHLLQTLDADVLCSTW